MRPASIEKQVRPATPILKDIVLVGCGHAHVAVLRRFGMRPMPGVRLSVIARDVETPYSGMLPGFIAGQYGFDDMHIDVRRLAKFAGARLFHGSATGIDPTSKTISIGNRPPVSFDIASIDIGCTPDLSAIAGAAEHAVAVKPIGALIARWRALEDRVAASCRPIRLGVIGDGAGAVELAFAVRQRFSRDQASVALFGAGPAILPKFGDGARARVCRALANRGVAVHPDHRAVSIEPGRVHFKNQSPAELDEILVATPAVGPAWLARTGLEVDAGGFLRVGETLQSISHPGVFAGGDVATIEGHAREKSGVIAVRAGPKLTENLRRAVSGRPLEKFQPQRTWLSLISTADGHAIGARGKLSFEGGWAWRWKDHIDRRFMRRFSDLSAMQAEIPTVAPGVADAAGRAVLAQAEMRCGGCAAKIGGSVLQSVLARLQPETAEIDLVQRDDAAAFAVPPGRLLVQSVDQFRAFIDDPHLFGRIVAHHCLGDLYAMGATPHSALALATVPFAPAARMEADLFAMLDGALSVLREAGAALIGGHSAEGLELALGFSVNGLAAPHRLLRKSGLRVGDALILTRPIGTGVLFAAEMRLRARARWIDACLQQMTTPAASAAACLVAHGASGCTDVTGFGLAGHLMEMAQASGMDIRLDLEAVPILDGAIELTAQGLASSLQADNRKIATGISASADCAATPRFRLLFDPQTAGGLLAGIAAADAETCLAELHRAGHHQAAIIGGVIGRSLNASRIECNEF